MLTKLIALTFSLLIFQTAHASTVNMKSEDPIVFHSWCDDSKSFQFCVGEFQKLCQHSIDKVTSEIKANCKSLNGNLGTITTSVDAMPPKEDNYLAGFACGASATTVCELP